MSSRTNPKIAVLMGGPSAEREVSLSSGRECATALREAGFYITEIDADGTLVTQLRDSGAEIAFNALHGRWGEDGCVQGLLEWIGRPYTHSGVLASALAMDKQKAKAVFEAVGLPVAESVIARKSDISGRHVLIPPYVVKPVNEGSSIGVHIVRETANGPPLLDERLPDRLMVETYVPGRELTTTVMGDRALTVTDVITDDWYDYSAKYLANGSCHVLPAKVPEVIFDACMDYAVQAHRALGCRGLSRVDFRWDERKGLEGLVLLEINTQPGMTPTSLTPEQAAHVGIGFADLCRWMVEDASCDR